MTATLCGLAPGHMSSALVAYPGTARAVFACKANSTVGVLREVLAQGIGADVASEGELAAALAAGADPASVIVHGNNKSDADLDAAVRVGCGLVVLDHPGSSTNSIGSPPPTGWCSGCWCGSPPASPPTPTRRS